MATATLQNAAPRFPVATSVGAYEARYRGASGGGPTGSVTDTAAVAANGTLTFTALSPGVQYVAYALVSGEHRYMAFAASDPPDLTGAVVKSEAPLNVIDFGGVGDDTATDTDAIIDAITLAATADTGGAVFFPGRRTYKTGNLTVADASGVSLIGEDRWSTTLHFAADTGADTFGLTLGLTYAFQAQSISDLRLNGPGAVSVMGTSPANMHGIRSRTGWLFERVVVQNFKGGFCFDADHVTMHNCNASSNLYGLYWLPAPTTFGDYEITSSDFDGNTMASVAVAADNRIDGAIWTRCHFGNGPYPFYKEPGAGDNTFLLSNTFNRCGFESWGNAMFKAPTAGKHMDALFINCQSAAGFSTDYDHPTDPKHAAIDMPGGNVIVRTIKSNPFETFGDEAIIKGALTSSRIESADTAIDIAQSNGLPIVVGSAVDSRLVTDGGNSELRLCQTDSALTQFDLCEMHGYENVQRSSASGTPFGVAAHTATSGTIAAVQVTGRTSIKRAGTNVATFGKYLKPHASTAGAVDVASAFSDGPIVAVSEADSSGATVPALLRGLV